jgi:hypothetical protein
MASISPMRSQPLAIPSHSREKMSRLKGNSALLLSAWIAWGVFW